MKTINDYADPWQAITDFETLIKQYTGAPYAIVLDSCTHAIELAFRVSDFKYTAFPSKTYLSVLMTMHHVGIQYKLTTDDWYDKLYYEFQHTNILDCARHFEPNMFIPNTIQCLSFGRTKPLEIGRGGCILTDDKVLAERLNRMRYDGRDIFKYPRWPDQKIFELGYHYYMKPEECITGIELLTNQRLTEQKRSFFNYPDCSEITIIS